MELPTSLRCDYAGCANLIIPTEDNFIGNDDSGVGWYVCEECMHKVEDYTGYCGVSCMCGYGCDQSC